MNPLRGIVGKNHWVSPNHHGEAKRFLRLEVSRSIGGQVVGDTQRFDCASLIRRKSGDEVSRCMVANLAQGSLRRALYAAVSADFDRIDVKFNAACRIEEHFHAKAVPWRGALDRNSPVEV